MHYRKQLMYRCGHFGAKECEIILKDWLTLNSAQLTRAELEQFDDEILSMEVPHLQRYLIFGQIVSDQDMHLKYLHVLLDYIEARKTDFKANTPERY